ncbi:hypothetical protein [Mycobacterium lepromatosis]|uniref:hypothetical protein n=1 Tax=Mycobacterium lepromatosis TaxID=480418 RepID=UPI0006796724|nr:hypothetical protein [Mycobacterium lepromatosis]
MIAALSAVKPAQGHYCTLAIRPREGTFCLTNETITTVGYGYFSFAQQPTWLRMYTAMLMPVSVTTTTFLVAYVANVLLSRRFVWPNECP